MALREGMRVEIRSNEDRYRLAWLEGLIVAAYGPPGRGQRYKIQYDHQNYHMDNGQPLTEEDVSSTQLRPTPPLVNSEKHTYSAGDAVEVYDNDCWWLGTVIQVLHVAKLSLIHIPYTGRLNTFHLSKLRHCQQWSTGKWSQLYFYSQVTLLLQF